MENTDNSETSFFSNFNLDFIKDIFLDLDLDYDFDFLQPYTDLLGDTDQQQPQDYLLNCEIGTMYNEYTESCEPHNEICHPTTQKKMQSSSDPGWPPRCECKDENNNILEGYDPDNNCNICKNLINQNQLGYIWRENNCIHQQDPSLNGCEIRDDWFNNERNTISELSETGMCTYCRSNGELNNYDPTTDCQLCLPDYVRNTDGNSCISCENGGTTTPSDEPENCICPANQLWVDPGTGSPNVCNICGENGLIINITDNSKKCFDKEYFHCDTPSGDKMSCNQCDTGYLPVVDVLIQNDDDDIEDFNEYMFCKPDFENMNFYHSFLVDTLNINEDLINTLNIQQSDLCGTSAEKGNYNTSLNTESQLQLVQSFKNAWKNADTGNIQTETDLQSIYEQVYLDNKYLDNICQCTQSEPEQSGTTPAGTPVTTSEFSGIDITQMYPNCDQTYGCPSPLESDSVENPCGDRGNCISPTTKTYQNLPGASEYWHWGVSDTEAPYFDDEVSLDSYFQIDTNSTHACICEEGYCGINCDREVTGIKKPNYQNLDPTDDYTNCIGSTCKDDYCGILCDQSFINDNISGKNPDTQACICAEGYCGENCEHSGPGIQGADPDDNNSCICLDNNRYINGPSNQCEIDLLNFCDLRNNFESTINNTDVIRSCTYGDTQLDENNYNYQLQCHRNYNIVAPNLVTYPTDSVTISNKITAVFITLRGDGTKYLTLHISLDRGPDDGRSSFLELENQILESGYIFLHTNERNQNDERFEQIYPNFFKVNGFSQHSGTIGSGFERRTVYSPYAYLELNIDDITHTDETIISYNFPWPQGSTGRVDEIGTTPEDTVVYYKVAVSHSRSLEEGGDYYTGGPDIIIPSSCNYCPENYIFDPVSRERPQCLSCNSQGNSDLASRRITNVRNDGLSDSRNQCDCDEGWDPDTFCQSCEDDYYNNEGECIACQEHSTRTGDQSYCICDENFYYDNGQCLECPNGSTRTNDGVTSNETQTSCDCSSISNWSPNQYVSVPQTYTFSNIENEDIKAKEGGPLDGPTCETCPTDHYWSPQYSDYKYKRSPQCSKCYLFDYDFNTGGYALGSEQSPGDFSFNTQDIDGVNNTPYTTSGSSNTQVGECDCPPGYEWSEPVCTRQPPPGSSRYECDYGCRLKQIIGTRSSDNMNECVPNINMGYCKQKHCTCLIDGTSRSDEIAEDVDPVGTDCPVDGQNLCFQCGSDTNLYTGETRNDFIMYQNGDYQIQGGGGASFASDFLKSTPTIRYENGQCNTVQCQCPNGTAATELSEGCINDNNNYKCKSCDTGSVLMEEQEHVDLILRASSSEGSTNWGGNPHNAFGVGSCYPKQGAGGSCSKNEHCGTTTTNPPSGWKTADGQSLSCKAMESGADNWGNWAYVYHPEDVSRCYLSKGAICEEQGGPSDGQKDGWCINYPSNTDACEDNWTEPDKCRT